MKAKFKGGDLDGQDVPIGEPPPRGLDVRHQRRVLRYGFEGREDDGAAIYHYAGRGSESSGPVIDIGGISATPLHYPPRRKISLPAPKQQPNAFDDFRERQAKHLSRTDAMVLWNGAITAAMRALGSEPVATRESAMALLQGLLADVF